MNNLPADLIADVEESFLGYWDDDLMSIVRLPYSFRALVAYAWRDGGAHIPADGAESGGAR